MDGRWGSKEGSRSLIEEKKKSSEADREELGRR
jgi:hypothetical protein